MDVNSGVKYMDRTGVLSVHGPEKVGELRAEEECFDSTGAIQSTSAHNSVPLYSMRLTHRKVFRTAAYTRDGRGASQKIVSDF